MATSLKDYLKRYQSVGGEEDKQPKKSKKKRKVAAAGAAAAAKVTAGLIIVDNDAVWQKNIDEDSDDPEVEGDEPQVLEDVDVKRMHQMERVKQHRPYMSIGDDGSGWSTVDNNRSADRKAQSSETLRASSPDASPPRRAPPSMAQDISPPRRISPEDSSSTRNPKSRNPNPRSESPDISPPRKRPARDTSPARRRNPRPESPDVSPPRRKPSGLDSMDSSPPRQKPNPNSSKAMKDGGQASGLDSMDSSPPRRKPNPNSSKAMKDGGQASGLDSMDSSPPRRKPNPNSTKLTMTDGRQAGLITNKAERAAELVKKKQEEARRLREMDGGGRGAETIYRDKRGKRLEGLEELLRQQQGDVKPEAKPLEWGKGLAQKRELEQQHAELEAEKAKPFARTRDDPELDKVFKERIRWGDPMAHLVKSKVPAAAELVDFGASEEMQQSGFLIPQLIPQHSWLKHGVGAPMNRYGIKPGRHWDGVDRSTGFENQMFKAKAEKQATDMEAYLWSVSDM